MLILAQHSPDWALSWKAPAECAQGDTVSRAVEQRLGYPVFGEPARFRIEGQVEKAEPGFHAQLTLKDADGAVLGTREVSTPEASCAALDARVTLVLSLMISPSGALGPTKISAAPAAPPAMLPPPPPPGPLLREEATVRVHLDSDEPRAQLIRLVENKGPPPFVVTTVLCEAPCDKPVKSAARLFIGGEGVIVSEEFSLAGLTAATVQVRTGSAGRRTAGVLTFALGTSAVVGGVALLVVGLLTSGRQSQFSSGLTIAGALLTAGGGAGIAGGLLLVRGTGTTVTVVPTF